MLVQIRTLKQLFQRNRRPGNLFFAILFLFLSLFLASQLGNQVRYMPSTKWSSQPALWPTISVYGMMIFATLNFISAVVSPRIEGRWQEVLVWARALEFVVWFMAYVFLVPHLGYLPSSILFAISMALRLGYRSIKSLGLITLSAITIVVIFKSFLQVKIPGGQAYELLPDSIRSFMLTYL